MDVLPSIPKGDTVGNVVIDVKEDGKGAAPKIRQKRQRVVESQRELEVENLFLCV